MNQHTSAIDAAEAELQQELREMFTVDTQQHLETYFHTIQQLNPQSWVADIQQLYRAIHTVKGGAVTVGADAMLQVAIVLEDLLSDLRYLEVAPVLTDDVLAQILLEAGELLSSSIEIIDTGDRAIAQVQPTVNRLEHLRDRVKQLYLPEWNELKQVHQEFAEQGFDLVILDLEMALAKLSDRGLVPMQTIDTATATIDQLAQIGIDIELAEDWTILLRDCQELIAKPDCQLWTAAWGEYFEILKICVKNSGELTPTEIDRLDKLTLTIASTQLGSQPAIDLNEANLDLSDSLDIFFCADEDIEASLAINAVSEASGFNENLLDSLDDFFLPEEVEFMGTADAISEQTYSESIEFSGELVDGADRFSLIEALSWHLDEDIKSPNIAVTVPIDSDLNFDIDTFVQPPSSIDPDLNFDIDTLVQSTAPKHDSDLNFDIDTFVQPPSSIDDFSSDLADVFHVFDEFFTDVHSESSQNSNLASGASLLENNHESLLSIDRFEPIESSDDLPDLLDNFFDDTDDRFSIFEPFGASQEVSQTELAQFSNLSSDELGSFVTFSEVDAVEFMAEIEKSGDLLAEIAASDRIAPDSINAVELPIVTVDPILSQPIAPVKRSVQIPVPLERLDKSAQQVIETLLTARAVTSISTQLQSQLTQLTTLTRENSQFVTRLRQLQDDYALLRNLSDEQQDSANNVTLERYRQGYTTIVRLLENILRLSELGQEIESSTYQSAIRLDALDRSILQLKDGIETSRLVPFRNLTSRAKAILRDLTNRYGKSAELVVENEQIELDAGIVQQLEPALLHLLRNAYDHGLERTQQRLDAGKSSQGKIQISLQQLGNLYLLKIEDDGAGIDANLIHDLAVAKGFALNRTRTNAELLAVLCQPGFSSSSTITEVSGRGVGMDVVVAQIESIGGRLSLETYPGYGTKFAIEVPAPQLLIPCVLFQVGDRTIALPTDNVLETALLSSMNIESSDAEIGRCTWKLTNLRGEIPGFDLVNYWQAGNIAPNNSPRSFPDTAVCIRTKHTIDTPEIWSIADDLLGQAKLLIDPLPSPLIPPVGLLGVSLQPDGRLISILDPIALTRLVTTTALQPTTANFDELATHDRSSELAQSSAPTILIVDDAAMIRRRLESSLNTYGFITHTCNDGLEALNWLQTNPHPDLMITDVEMPNMDGFTLIDRARQAKIDIPILVVSSRSSEEWGKEARRLGASDYLNKGFSTSEMLQKVNALLGLLVDV